MMAIGERIHFFRILRGMTQKYLGTIVGFPERSADVRLAQYETGTRKPRARSYCCINRALDVSSCPRCTGIDSYIGLMHTLFTLEDLYGLTVSRSRRRNLSESQQGKRPRTIKMLYAWKEQADKLSSKKSAGKNTITGVTTIRKFDTTQRWAKYPHRNLVTRNVKTNSNQINKETKNP